MLKSELLKDSNLQGRVGGASIYLQEEKMKR